MTPSRQFGEAAGYGLSGMLLGICCAVLSLTPGMYLFAGITGMLGIVFSGARIDYQRSAGGAPDATAIIGLVFAMLGIVIAAFSLINLMRAFP